jgi:Cu/Ag efflux protein CusF
LRVLSGAHIASAAAAHLAGGAADTTLSAVVGVDVEVRANAIALRDITLDAAVVAAVLAGTGVDFTATVTTRASVDFAAAVIARTRVNRTTVDPAIRPACDARVGDLIVVQGHRSIARQGPAFQIRAGLQRNAGESDDVPLEGAPGADGRRAPHLEKDVAGARSIEKHHGGSTQVTAVSSAGAHHHRATAVHYPAPVSHGATHHAAVAACSHHRSQLGRPAALMRDQLVHHVRVLRAFRSVRRHVARRARRRPVAVQLRLHRVGPTAHVGVGASVHGTHAVVHGSAHLLHALDRGPNLTVVGVLGCRTGGHVRHRRGLRAVGGHLRRDVLPGRVEALHILRVAGAARTTTRPHGSDQASQYPVLAADLAPSAPASCACSLTDSSPAGMSSAWTISKACSQRGEAMRDTGEWPEYEYQVGGDSAAVAALARTRDVLPAGFSGAHLMSRFGVYNKEVSMKTLLIGAVAAGFVAAVTGSANAQQSSTPAQGSSAPQAPAVQPSAQTPSTQTGTTASANKDASGSANKDVSGVVKKIDKDKRSIKISSLAGVEQEVKLAATATITRDGTLAGLDQLKEGDDVRASFDPSSNQATKLEVQSKHMDKDSKHMDKDSKHMDKDSKHMDKDTGETEKGK